MLLQQAAQEPPTFTPPEPERLSAAIPGFAVEALIGTGATAAVYRARQRSVDRVVALNVLAPTQSRRDIAEAKFRENLSRMMSSPQFKDYVRRNSASSAPAQRPSLLPATAAQPTSLGTWTDLTPGSTASGAAQPITVEFPRTLLDPPVASGATSAAISPVLIVVQDLLATLSKGVPATHAYAEALGRIPSGHRSQMQLHEELFALAPDALVPDLIAAIRDQPHGHVFVLLLRQRRNPVWRRAAHAQQ